MWHLREIRNCFVTAAMAAAVLFAAGERVLLGADGPTSASAKLIRVEGLGSLYFPNSGNQAAQEPFVRGVLLLHSFEFEPAQPKHL